ncbi:putative gamma-glutamylcyclotransferase CG2811 isoform X1 [Rhipicephalus sanguineus]|uniref:putative gamma-glutamylcyclotransferase CG2811 isoform X1 n=2 Tax=Rhipicephalus sanguineus TaxID=34632 RepID=UPI0020C45302|nr:putative gamma-glutamylcyclotransferase CG2811 isoform X1 [Rhipicephalus sanguineus]
MLQKMSHYVFVYGTLKTGETNHRIMTNPGNGRSTLIGQARTLKKWPLVLVSKYEIPCLLPCEGLGHEVCGEVYQVDDRMLEVLDWLESHPDFYVRSQEDVVMLSQPHSSTDVEGTTVRPSSTEAGDKRKAWVYFVRKFERELLSLPTVPHYTRKPGIELPEFNADEKSRRFLDNGFQRIAASALSACIGISACKTSNRK